MFLSVYSFLNRFTRCSLDEMSTTEKEKRDNNPEHLFECLRKCTFRFHSLYFGRIESGTGEAGFSLHFLASVYFRR